MQHTLEISGVRLLFGERLILSDVYLKIETGSVVGCSDKTEAEKEATAYAIRGTGISKGIR